MSLQSPISKESPTGLRKNWKQFSLLILVNAFVGGMMGMERSIFPQFAKSEFGISSSTALLSFIFAFGITKAMANYFAGKLSNTVGRKNVLVLGWLLALPVPILLINAQLWWHVIFANVLLGISQGLTWSSTIVMKMDMVGEKDRGLAMGLNEFSGYLFLGIVAFLSAGIANKYGVTPYPFYIGIVISVLGTLISVLWVKDTGIFMKSSESKMNKTHKLKSVFWETTFRNKTLSSVTQAGIVNNLNDGMIWGLLPILLLSLKFNTSDTGVITAIYPAVWGVGQLFTGKLSDLISKKKMLVAGMFLQGLAILFIPENTSFYALALLLAVLGLGTAFVYPTFITIIAETTNDEQRAESIGVFRLWRDLGYAMGAIISGITADLFGTANAIVLVGVITILSSLLLQLRIPKN